MATHLLTSAASFKSLHDLQRAKESQDIHPDFDAHHIALNGLLFDYSKHRIDDEVLSGLMALADERGVSAARDAMFAGKPINQSEGRAVLHTALRGSVDNSLEIEGENVSDFVDAALEKIQHISEHLRDHPQIDTIVNLGIGGSDLGPRMAYKALKPHLNGPRVFFLSNIDASGLYHRLNDLRAKNTAFVISTKSFSTMETYENAKLAKTWLLESLSEDEANARLYSCTSNIDAAHKFGISDDHILPLRDWVGGRFSVWGSIGLPLAVAYGFDAFKDFLRGAQDIDTHFKTAPMDQNIPVLMALLGVWYRNFWDYGAHALLPYSHDLRDFPVFMQQMDMESNGKGVTQDGEALDYKPGPVIFGESGTNSQHTFMQMLHQSPEIVPCDFIGFANPSHPHMPHHEKLLANMLAQSEALVEGRISENEPHRNFNGNRPSSTLIFDRLDAYHLGMLIALYEHKIFVQGVIWGINSFDQWGVELGKTMAENITQALESNNENDIPDTSTRGLLRHIREKFIKS